MNMVKKSSKYFFSLEKAKYNAKTCYSIFEKEGNLVSDPEKILNIQSEFYADLYSEDREVLFTLKNSSDTKVSSECRKIQDLQISMQDLETSIKGMNNNKTPGYDGLPVEFYKMFWQRIKQVFFDMVLEVYETGFLHPTARMGILNLIPKATKDTRLVKNLRPITLLNVDYKIIEKAIANKMIPALEDIIHSDQRGFMKNRRISVNIRKLLDIMHVAKEEDIEALVLSLDFVKCFDRCSFSILHGSLEFFGFGQYVKKWTKILYKDFIVKIQNNGFFSSEIPIHKGVHQGGCCSSIYFLVIAEILAMTLRGNEKVQGITIGQIKNILNQFADDADVFSINSEESIREIFRELEWFRKQSGFMISNEKTMMYRIGSLRHSNAQLYGIDQVAWSNEDITVLGVTVSHDNIVEKNYEIIQKKIRQTLGSWVHRGLTLTGRVLVVNTLVMSLLIYKMMVLPMIPERVIKNIDNEIRNYLWNGKRAKIAYSILKNPVKEGGLNLTDIKNREIALKATWPQVLSTEDDYSAIVYYIIDSELSQNVWRVSLLPDDVKYLKITNQFWVDVVKCWCTFNFSYGRTLENQMLWYNSCIRVENRPIFWRKLYRKGLLYVYQFFQDGQIIEYEQMRLKYNVEIMQYNAIITAIPKEWKEFFVELSQKAFLPVKPSTFDRILQVQQLSKIVYQYINGDFSLTYGKTVKWNTLLQQDWDINYFNKLHVNIKSLSNYVKIRDFQYRFLQRAIITNIQLNEWGLRSSKDCSFCELYSESILHLFYECREVRPLWIKYQKLALEVYSQEISINVTNVVTNDFCQPKTHIVNSIAAYLKQYIYRQRCLKKGLCFTNFMKYMDQIRNIEKYIAIKNNNMHLFKKKWDRNNVQRNEMSVNETIIQYIENL